MRNGGKLAILGPLLLGLSGCDFGTPEVAPPPPRPVLSVVLQPVSQTQIGYAGTIEPRYKTDRGFQVLGRVIDFQVSVGDVVKSGQVLARLDPTTFDIAVRSSESDVVKSKSQLMNAVAAEQRISELFAKQVSSQADLDAARQSREAAQASLDQAEANLSKAREQRGYATLAADTDGVVTSTAAEVGQTVSPGATVLTIARMEVREAVVDLPETVTSGLAAGAPFEIDLQADPSITTTGKVREIAPEADASTRTRRVRITLDRVVEAFRLGATITAKPVAPAEGSGFRVPRSALLEDTQGTRVWLVDAQAKTVKSVPVQIDPVDTSTIRIATGVAEGDRIVTAGVHSLQEGQAVRIDEEVVR